MTLFICSSLGGFMGFSCGTYMFTKYQQEVEKQFSALSENKKDISEDL